MNLTLDTVTCVPAPTSQGTRYAISGTTLAAREALVARFGNPEPSGYHYLDQDSVVALTRDMMRGEIAAAKGGAV